MTRAMLLCAGLGTRLGSLSDERPKPMLPVCDVPIVRYGIALLVGHGIRDIVINTHHKGDVIERELGDGRAFGARLRYSQEDPILGTGGGLKHALPLLDPDGVDEPFVSMNGKLVFDVDLGAVLEAHRRAGDTLGTMVVRRVPDAKAWGAVDVDPTGRVRNILGDGDFMFCGVHVTRPSVIRRLPEGEACMVRQGYLPWIQAGGRVTAYVHEHGYFAEHSTPERYLESNVALLRGAALRFPPQPAPSIHPSAEIDPTATLRGPVHVGPGAVIGAGAHLGPDVVVGTGARVASGAHLTRVIVWAGAHAHGTLNGAIVTPSQVIAVQPAL